MAVETTFEVFVQLLKEAIDDSTDLSDTMKVALKARADALTRTQLVKLSAGNVLSSTNVTVSVATDSMTVADGDSGHVIFDLMEFDTPVRIEGTHGEVGALVGHVGLGTNPPVDNSDMTLSYRLGSTGTFVAFRQTTVLPSVSEIQFRLDVAVQTGDHDIPQLHAVAEQL